jgi:hypothetical protein
MPAAHTELGCRATGWVLWPHVLRLSTPLRSADQNGRIYFREAGMSEASREPLRFDRHQPRLSELLPRRCGFPRLYWPCCWKRKLMVPCRKRLYRSRGGEWDEPDVDACARRRNSAGSVKVRPPSLSFSSFYTQHIIIYTVLSVLQISQPTTCVIPASLH